VAFDPRLEFYAITDQLSGHGRTDLAIAKELIQGGCSCLQYRAKKTSPKERRETAFALRELTRAAGVFFVVNDHLDLALDCGADAVHLGQDDMPLVAALSLAAGRLLIGRSTHSLGQALEAQAQGADYIGYGPIYATATKENNVPPVGVDSLKSVLACVSIPIVVIGGIKEPQLEQVARAGGRHVAVVTALTGAENVELTTRNYVARWRELRRRFS
jgi:thiamine-phosphate pyrophosphorylase